jgi:hypothetical protein
MRHVLEVRLKALLVKLILGVLTGRESTQLPPNLRIRLSADRVY